jgi:hypothetical protein
MNLSRLEAKNLIIQAQLLTDINTLSPLKIIKHLGYVQIDTISVVERAHHHVLWSRNHSYTKDDLAGLLKKKKVIEYWSHAAAYLPIEHYRYCLPRMHEYRNGKSHFRATDKKMMNFVLDRIKNEGPLMSKDFKSETKASGWYDWKPAKRALEQLFMDGSLMVCERRGFQKVYDLKDNMIPSHIKTSMPTDFEYCAHIIKTQLKALGLAKLTEIAYMKSGALKKKIQKTLRELVEDKKVVQVNIEDEIYFALKSFKLGPLKLKSEIHILSPFDNFIIQRKRLSELFDFDYQIECYVPEPKRKFGYFTHPVLYGNKLIGRIDLKAHRKTRELEIINYFSEGDKLTKMQQSKLNKKLELFAEFNKCVHRDLSF